MTTIAEMGGLSIDLHHCLNASLPIEQVPRPTPGLKRSHVDIVVNIGPACRQYVIQTLVSIIYTPTGALDRAAGTIQRVARMMEFLIMS